MLDALVKWVEQGEAPTQVMAAARPGANADVPPTWSSNGKPRTRPLCAWPAQARYSGSGDINDGTNFRCQ
jgi:feruloyl esterase